MSGGDNQAEAVAGAVATKIVAKIKPKRESDPVYIRVVFAGAVLALIGFFLPWYSVVFAPPGGSVTVHHTTVHAFSFTYNGLTESGTTPGNVLARSPIRCGSRAASAGAPPRSRRLTTC